MCSFFLEASLSEEFTHHLVQRVILLLPFPPLEPFFSPFFCAAPQRGNTQVLANNNKVRSADRMDRAADRHQLASATSHSAD